MLAAGADVSAASTGGLTALHRAARFNPNPAVVEALQPPADGPPRGRLSNSVGMEFALVPRGEFVMGSSSRESKLFGNEEPLTSVQITRAFWLGTHEVTEGQWLAVTGDRSRITQCGSGCPVRWVDRGDALHFVRLLNVMAGGGNYRLPSEAKWGYAARAGTIEDRYSSDLDATAWCGGTDSDSNPHPVGQKEPNAFGLHDMLGNVWEWVGDWYGRYPGSAATNPTGPADPTDPEQPLISQLESGTLIGVVRGGSWDANGAYCRASSREAYPVLLGRSGRYGLRIAITATDASPALLVRDDHGDDPSSATRVPIGTDVIGRIERAGDADYFRLEPEETATVTIRTTGGLNTDVTFMDGDSIYRNDAGRNSRIERTLAPGVYHVRVEAAGSATGSYSLHVERRTEEQRRPADAGGQSLTEFTNSIGMQFALVPAGEFWMGSVRSDLSDVGPVTQVRISREFWIGKHEVTQGQWVQVMGANPSEFSMWGDDCPVDSLSWDDAQEFLRRLNAIEGGSPYRLPTEAEWE